MLSPQKRMDGVNPPLDSPLNEIQRKELSRQREEWRARETQVRQALGALLDPKPKADGYGGMRRMMFALIGTRSMAAVGRAAGVEVGQVSRVLRGMTEPRLGEAIRIAHAIGISVECLAVVVDQLRSRYRELRATAVGKRAGPA